MLAGVSFRPLAVYLFEDFQCNSVTFFHLAVRQVIAVKLGYLHVENVLTAVKSVLTDVTGHKTEADIGKVLAAVESPVSDSFHSRRNSYLAEGAAPGERTFADRSD